MMWCRGHAWEEQKKERGKNTISGLYRIMQIFELENTNVESLRVHFIVKENEMQRGYVTFPSSPSNYSWGFRSCLLKAMILLKNNYFPQKVR